ncbi:MAG: hypothetical protein K1W24_02915 [Lachnospiraceae bacterium]
MDYRVISKFKCNGIDMVVVKLRNCVHAITMEEWRKIYGRNNLDRWDKVTDCGSHSSGKGYGKFADGKECNKIAV